MKRREFLKATICGGLGLTVGNGLDRFLNHLEAAEPVDLVVARGKTPAEIATAAINALGGMQKFVSRGDVVVVKPNIGWDRTPEQGANTNPEVVSTLIRFCFEAGAKKVKVFDRTVNDARRCYQQSGIAEAARLAGAEVTFTDERKFRDMKLSGLAIKEWPLYTEIFEADKVINVPIAKTHGSAILTMGLKNWMGIMGGHRGRIHQRLDGALVDVALVARPVLTYLDAVRILTANGPQGGNPADVKPLNLAVVSTDPVAVDAYGATLFGLKGSDLGYVKTAQMAGLGTMDLSKIKIREVGA